MERPALIALLIVAAVVAANPSLDARRGTAAPQGATPAPTLVPGALCRECNEIAVSLRAEQENVWSWQEELKRERAEELNDVALDIIRNEIRRNREQRRLMTERYEATGQQAFADRIKELDAQYDAAVKEAGKRAREHQMEIEDAESGLRMARSTVKELEGQLERCNKEKCSKRSAGGDSPSGTGGSGSPGERQSTSAGCEDCDSLAERIKAVESELGELAEKISGIQTTQDQLADAKAKATTTAQQRQLDAQSDRVNKAHADATNLEREKTAELERLHNRLRDCSTKCAPKETSQIFRGPLPYAVGGAIAVVALIAGGSDSAPAILASPNVPPSSINPSAPTTNTPPANTPPTNTVPECNSVAGSYSLTGTLRQPRSCQFAGISPIFATPISATMTLLVDASCSGTATLRHPNTWMFAHLVMVEASGSSFRVRSRTPFMSTQPFGIQFSSSLDVTTGGAALTGTEVHQGPNCTDTYDLTGSRTGS